MYFGTCAMIIRNTIAAQIDQSIDQAEEIENETDQYLT